jgi:hypothetical protein
MPPKKTLPIDSDPESDPKHNAIMAQLAAMNRRLDKVDLLSEQLGNIEESMKQLAAENTDIKSSLAATQNTLHTIQGNQIRMDQYNRSWSVRIMELPLAPEEENNPFRLVEVVYSKVFLPILQGALEKDLIPRIPSCEQLLERAHVLPAPKPGVIKPIICRFLNRDYRAVCFRLKKEFATRATGDVGDKRPRYAYPFYEDLSAATFKKMKELQADPRVESCWSINGQLRFRLSGSDVIKRVNQIMDPVETILK